MRNIAIVIPNMIYVNRIKWFWIFRFLSAAAPESRDNLANNDANRASVRVMVSDSRRVLSKDSSCMSRSKWSMDLFQSLWTSIVASPRRFCLSSSDGLKRRNPHCGQTNASSEILAQHSGQSISMGKWLGELTQILRVAGLSLPSQSPNK